MNKTPLLVQRNPFLRKETPATSCPQTSWVQNDLMVSFWWVAAIRLITGMGYPLLKIPRRGLLSRFGAAVVSRLPLS